MTSLGGALQQTSGALTVGQQQQYHHQKQLSTPLPLSSTSSSGLMSLPNPQHQQFKSISLNSTPTRNLTVAALPYGSPHGGLAGAGPQSGAGSALTHHHTTPSLA